MYESLLGSVDSEVSLCLYMTTQIFCVSVERVLQGLPHHQIVTFSHASVIQHSVIKKAMFSTIAKECIYLREREREGERVRGSIR